MCSHIHSCHDGLEHGPICVHTALCHKQGHPVYYMRHASLGITSLLDQGGGVKVPKQPHRISHAPLPCTIIHCAPPEVFCKQAGNGGGGERDTSCFCQGACATFQMGFGATCNWHRGCTAQAHRKVTLYGHGAIQPTGHEQYMASTPYPPPPSAFALSTRQQIAVDTQSVAIRWQFNTGGCTTNKGRVCLWCTPWALD
jgi:hypothetical protein